MAASNIGINEPGTPNKKLASQTVTRAAEDHHREEVVLSNASTDGALAEVLNSAPSTEYGLVTRNIPSGTQNVGDGGGSLTVDALDLDIRNLVPAQDEVKVSGTAAVASPPSGNPVAIAGTDGTNVRILKLDTSGEAQVDVLTLPALPAGTNNIGDVDVLTLPALPAGTNNIGDVDVLTLPALPAGTNNIGDVDVLTIAAGTNTIGDVGIKPRTSGGLSKFHLISAASTNATNIKSSAGQVFGWYIFNANAAMRKVAFHNASGTPTAGASIYFVLCIPANSAANVFSETGIAFSTGIAITTVTGIADSDSTAVAANDLAIEIFYS